MPTIQSLVGEDPLLVHAQYWYSIPLRFAVLGGHANAVQLLLDAGSEPGIAEAGLFIWEDHLEVAKNRGFEDVHRVLIDEMKRRYRTDLGNTHFGQFREAIDASHFDKAIKLIHAQPDLISISDIRGNSTLHLAAGAGSLELVDACLDLGAAIDARNAEERDAFELGNEDVKRRLLERGAQFDFFAACSLGDEKRVNEFIAEDADLAKRLNRAYSSPLMLAAKAGHLSVVTTLLDHGADPNLKEQKFDRGGALFMASASGHYNIAKLLLERGADPNGPCESSGTSADHAANEEISKLLLEHGSTGRWSEASGEPQDIKKEILDGQKQSGENGFDPLLARVIWSNDAELLTLYLDQFGADPLRELFPGSGPGGWFVPKDCSGAFLDQLISAGFEINRPSWVGRTHLHFLASRNHLETARFFVERGADMNFVSLESGTTPLGSAAYYGHKAVVQFLLAQGADSSLPQGRPELQPLALAEQRGHDEIAEILRSAT